MVILTAGSLVICACCVIIGQYLAAGIMALSAVADVAIFWWRRGR